jgi:signal transduction histidine kinase
VIFVHRRVESGANVLFIRRGALRGHPQIYLVLTADAAFAPAIRDVIAAQLPGATADALAPAAIKTRPVADGVIVDGRADAAAAATLAARLRAMGFAGALVVVADGTGESATALDAAGAAGVRPADIATRLVAGIADQLERNGSEHAPAVMRARRVIAAGEIALGFQHALNNPLAGILAEAQLMQLDPVTPEQHAALERIVTLCRRIVELGKSLDGMSDRK